MSDKAIEVIAGALKAIDDDWVKTQQPASALEHAAYIFDALKAARIAVVELPEPDSTRYEGDEHESQDRLCWMPGDDFEVSVWNPGEVQRHGFGWGDAEPLSADEAWRVGLALLAASVAARAVTP